MFSGPHAEMSSSCPLLCLPLNGPLRRLLERNGITRISELIKRANEHTLRNVTGVGNTRIVECFAALEECGYMTPRNPGGKK